MTRHTLKLSLSKNCRIIPVILLLVLVVQFPSRAQALREVRFEQLDSLLAVEDDVLHVVNFWATWCKPCVAELPLFRKAADSFDGEKLQFVFISLDFPLQVESKLKPFLEANPLPGQVWWLNEKKFNKMINQVEANWSGAIPFTLFFWGSTGFRQYKEGEMEHGELENIITNLLDHP